MPYAASVLETEQTKVILTSARSSQLAEAVRHTEVLLAAQTWEILH